MASVGRRPERKEIPEEIPKDPRRHQVPCEGHQVRRLSVRHFELMEEGHIHCYPYKIFIYSEEYREH